MIVIEKFTVIEKSPENPAFTSNGGDYEEGYEYVSSHEGCFRRWYTSCEMLQDGEIEEISRVEFQDALEEALKLEWTRK